MVLHATIVCSLVTSFTPTRYSYIPKQGRGSLYLLELASIRRRDITRLVYDVLCVVQVRPASKYRIMCEAKLNFLQAEGILSFLLDNGHLELGLRDNRVKEYVRTPKGESLRGFIAEVQDELDGLSIREMPSRLHSLGKTPKIVEGPNSAFDSHSSH